MKNSFQILLCCGFILIISKAAKATKESLVHNSQDLRNFQPNSWNSKQCLKAPTNSSQHVVDLLQNWYHTPTNLTENDQKFSKTSRTRLPWNVLQTNSSSKPFEDPTNPYQHVLELLQNWCHNPTKLNENDLKSLKTQRSRKLRNVEQTNRSFKTPFIQSKKNHLEAYKFSPNIRKLNHLNVFKGLNPIGIDLASFKTQRSGNPKNIQQTNKSSKLAIANAKNCLSNSNQTSLEIQEPNPLFRKLNRLVKPQNDMDPNEYDLESSKTQRFRKPKKVQSTARYFKSATSHFKNSLINPHQTSLEIQESNPKIPKLNRLDNPTNTSLRVVDVATHTLTNPFENDLLDTLKTQRSQKSRYPKNIQQNISSSKSNSLSNLTNILDIITELFPIWKYALKTDPLTIYTPTFRKLMNVLANINIPSNSTENNPDFQNIREASPRTTTQKPKELPKFQQRSRKYQEIDFSYILMNVLANTRNLKENSNIPSNTTKNKQDSHYIEERFPRITTKQAKELLKFQQGSRKNQENDFSNIRQDITRSGKPMSVLANTRNFKQTLNILTNLTEYKKDYHYVRERSLRTTSQQVKELLELPERSRKLPKIFQILLQNLSSNNLKSLKSFFTVDTLVLYGRQETLREFIQDFHLNLPPFILITSFCDKELSYNFNSNFLSLVFLGFHEEEEPFKSLLLDTVNRCLNRRRLQKLILITKSSVVKEQDKVVLIFNWLYEHGYWNSLLLDKEGNSLFVDHLNGSYIRNLSVREFLLKTINWQDLKNYPISCSMGSNPPRAYIHYNTQQEVILKGYYGAIINLFVKYYNATLKPFVLSHLQYYTELDCVKYIKNGTVDICGDVLTINPEYVITYPEEISSSYLMVPYDKPLARFYYFLKPFHFSVWTIVNCSFFYKVLTLSFIHRLQHGNWNCSLNMLYATLSVMFLPFHLTHVRGGYRRFLELLMILVGFVVSNWYLSVLSSLLFTRLYSHNIKSLKDLAQQNISIMVNEFDVYVLNATVNDPIIEQQLLLVSNDVLLQHRRNLDPNFAYYSQSDKIELYLHQQKFLLRPRLKVLAGIPPINEVLAGIPMSANWPFQHLLNKFIRRILDSGLYQRLLATAQEEGIINGYLHYFPTEHHYVEPLSIEYFQMPAMLLAVGYALALLGFLLEIYVFK